MVHRSWFWHRATAFWSRQKTQQKESFNFFGDQTVSTCFNLFGQLKITFSGLWTADTTMARGLAYYMWLVWDQNWNDLLNHLDSSFVHDFQCPLFWGCFEQLPETKSQHHPEFFFFIFFSPKSSKPKTPTAHKTQPLTPTAQTGRVWSSGVSSPRPWPSAARCSSPPSRGAPQGQCTTSCARRSWCKPPPLISIGQKLLGWLLWLIISFKEVSDCKLSVRWQTVMC